MTSASDTGRFAILIESGMVGGHDELPGARKDLDTWKSFLSSDLGGAWEEREMAVLHMPPLNLVRGYLKRHAGEYIFLAFSGHGREDVYADGRRRICACLNSADGYVDVDELTPASFGTAVLDCCRWNDGTVIANGAPAESFAAAMDSLAESARRPLTPAERARIREEKRSAWMGALRKWGVGRVQMFACGSMESAGENPKSGGFYTSFLTKAARKWERDEAFRHHGIVIYSTLQAHDSAVRGMAARNPQQHPQYVAGVRNQQYPFAVR